MSASTRFCPSCGKPVAADARFCPSCGATLAVAPAPPVPSYTAPPTYPASQPTYQPTPHKSNTKLIIAIVVIVVVVLGVIGAIAAASFLNTVSTATAWHTANIVSSTVPVQAGNYWSTPFTVPAGATSVIVNGTFTASGGSGNDIKVYVLDQTNYVNWQNGHGGTSYYQSGQVTTGTISANLPGPGTYYLVLDNTFSSISTKNVQTTATLYYQG